MLWFGKSATDVAARGVSYVNSGQFDLAIAEFDEAIRLNPHRANLFGLRGFAYGAKGQHDRSIADYDEAIRCDTKNADYFSMRGVAHALIEQLDLAIADFDAAIRLDPERADFFHGRGCAYYDKGQHDRAARDYIEAHRLDPNLAAAFRNSGAARFKSGAYDQAISDFTEAIRLDQNDAFSFVARGVVYAAKGQPNPAIADFDEAIRLNPQNSLAFDNRGSAYGKRGEFERAIADHDEAIRLDPKDAIFFCNRGVTYYLAEQYDRAIADYDEAIRLDLNLTQAIRSRAKAIDMKNNFCANDTASTQSAKVSDDIRSALTLGNVAKPMTLSLLGTYKMPSSLKTTVRDTGLATFFSKAGSDYVVSTIHRKELNGFYQTSILKRSSDNYQGGPHRAEPQVVYRIEGLSQLQSVQEHIGTVRMALSKDEGSWLGTKSYQDDVMNASLIANQRNNCQQEMSWTDKRIRNFISAANINYKSGLFGRLFLS